MEALVSKRTRSLVVLSPDLTANESEGFPASNDGVHTLHQLFDSVRRYKRLVVMIIILGSMLAAVIGFLGAPSYLATAELAVDIQPSAGVNGNSATPSATAEESIIDTHVTVLLSDAYLRRLLPKLQARDDARRNAGSGSPSWREDFRALVGRIWSATKALILLRKRESYDSEALAALKRSLTAGQERHSRIIGVSFADPDPERAADIANMLAQAHVDESAQQKQAGVEQALNSLAAQSAQIQDELAKAEQELKSYAPGQASTSRDGLEWRVTTLAQWFEMILRRRQELTASSLLVQPDVSLLAAASPPDHPTSLHPLLIVPPAAIIFALLGCALAVVLNRLDRTLHTEAHAAEALHIPCAGSVPAIAPKPTNQLHHILARPASDYARAIRSILVSLVGSGPTTPRSQQIILVTSSIGGEGKTTLSLSLALYAARVGRRTLLLDFGDFTRRHGDESASLLEVLTKDHPLAEIIKRSPDLGIDYLPARLSDENRLQILTHPKLSTLLRQISDAYHFVIIDGPAILEAPEATLLASWADHVLFAIRCGSTSRETAQAALHQLARIDPIDPAHDTRLSSVLMRVAPTNRRPQPQSPFGGPHYSVQVPAKGKQKTRAA